jgi:hypothetical protein
MSLSDNYPDIRALWMNDYANAGVIDPRCSFARSDSTPSNVHFWSSEDHLSSENLLLQSSSLDTSPWTTSGASVNPTSVTGPDGATSDGWTLTEDGATNNHRVVQTFSANAPSDSYALTFYGKRGTGTRYASVVAYTSTNNYEIATFDLAGGAVTFYSGSSSTYTGVSATQTASGNGYYKCVFKFTGQVSGGAVYMSDVASPTSWGNYAVYQYAGDSSSSLVLSRFSLASTAATDYNATTTQIHREYAATLKSVAYSGQPRFEYEPTGDRGAKGLLIEGQSSNLIGSSEDFSTSWQLLNATKSLEAIAPNGALNAIAFREGTNSLEKRLLRYYGASSGDATISVYAKLLGNARRLVIREANASAQYATFDLVTGTKVSGLGSIESVGNGWFRCQLNLSTNGTLQAAGFYIVPADGNYGNREYAGDGYSGVATADIGYTGGPVTLFAESSTQTPAYNSNNRGVVDLSEPASSYNRVMIYNRGAQAGGFLVNADNVQQGSGFGGITDDSYTKVGVSVDTNSIKHCVNGGTVSTDTSAVIPDGLTKMFIGQTRSGSGFGGHIKRIYLYPESTTDTELQSLTS